MLKSCWYLLAIFFSCTFDRNSLLLDLLNKPGFVPDSVIGNVLFCDSRPEHFGRFENSIVTIFNFLVGNFKLDTLEWEEIDDEAAFVVRRELAFCFFLGFINIVMFHLVHNIVSRIFCSAKQKESSQSMLAEFAHNSNVGVSMKEWFLSLEARSFDSLLHAPEMVRPSPPLLFEKPKRVWRFFEWFLRKRVCFRL